MALSANREILEKNSDIVSHPVVASDIIYKGALCKINAAGNLAPCAAEAGGTFAGVAYEKKDNSAGSAGDLVCKVVTSGLHLLTGTGFALTDVGSVVYATDDAVITTTYAANLQRVGTIEQYESSTQVWVRLEVGGAGISVAGVADLGSTSNLTALVVEAATISASDFTASNAAEPTKAEIDVGIDALKDKVITALGLKADNADVETLRTEVEARLDAIEAKIDATLAALRAAKVIQG